MSQALSQSGSCIARSLPKASTSDTATMPRLSSMARDLARCPEPVQERAELGAQLRFHGSREKRAAKQNDPDPHQQRHAPSPRSDAPNVLDRPVTREVGERLIRGGGKYPKLRTPLSTVARAARGYQVVLVRIHPHGARAHDVLTRAFRGRRLRHSHPAVHGASVPPCRLDLRSATPARRCAPHRVAPHGADPRRFVQSA